MSTRPNDPNLSPLATENTRLDSDDEVARVNETSSRRRESQSQADLQSALVEKSGGDHPWIVPTASLDMAEVIFQEMRAYSSSRIHLGTTRASGLDVRFPCEYTMKHGETLTVNTGVKITFNGCVSWEVRPRSSMGMLRGVYPHHGTIDDDYLDKPIILQLSRASYVSPDDIIAIAHDGTVYSSLDERCATHHDEAMRLAAQKASLHNDRHRFNSTTRVAQLVPSEACTVALVDCYGNVVPVESWAPKTVRTGGFGSTGGMMAAEGRVAKKVD